MKYLALFICTINSWNALLCCCAGEKDVVEPPACHAPRMTCHQAGEDESAAENDALIANVARLASSCHCRDHQRAAGEDVLMPRLDPEPAPKTQGFAVPTSSPWLAARDRIASRFSLSAHPAVSARGTPSLAQLSRFLI